MRAFEVAHRVFKVSDFLGWQREGALELSPSFQRRPVWKKSAKSYLLDTIVRGLPVPVVFVRERIDLDTQRTIREVVDGQQRLRTLFSFIDKSLLTDYDPAIDEFTVERRHNKAVSGKRFDSLPDDIRTQILSYEFSTQVLPSSAEDRDVLQIFARLNSTGDQLNHQELRNAKYFGEFKALMYELAVEQLERWRAWGIFSEHEIARMKEVELTSDLVITMLNGVYGKSQRRIDKTYNQYDQEFPGSKEIGRRFRETMDLIDELVGFAVGNTIYVRDVFFYSLFAFCYDVSYGFATPMTEKGRRAAVSKSVGDCLLDISTRFRNQDVPEEVVDAVSRASSDLGRRQTRHGYLLEVCG